MGHALGSKKKSAVCGEGEGLGIDVATSEGRSIGITQEGRLEDLRLGFLVVETDLRFGYGHVDLSGFSPGTTFYLSGAPVGQVRTVRVPEGSGEVVLDLLESVRVRWTLVRGGPVGGCPGGWTVASAKPVEGSEKTIEITWIF